MAVLTDEQRREVWADTMRLASAAREPLGTLLKADLRAAVNAVDDWVDQNAASYNAAIPLPARDELSAKQKVRLLQVVVRARLENQHG